MGSRRKSRELAMQALFDMDMSLDVSEKRLEAFRDNFCPSQDILPFFLEIVEGILQEKQTIDTLIERHSSNWKISRMSLVDRNIMRVAVYELLFCDDIPATVSINEAIDISKKFGTEESGAFINGILDSIHIYLQENKNKP